MHSIVSGCCCSAAREKQNLVMFNLNNLTMKTVKTIFSVAAVMFAIAGALATNSETDTSMALVPVTNPGDGTCTQIGRCNNTTVQDPCEISENVAYKIRETSPLACSLDATGVFIPNP